MNVSLEKELVESLSRENGIVDFVNGTISLQKMSLICDYLRKNATAKRLNLWDCGITDEHCKLISQLLKENTSIKFLNLDYADITSEGIDYLALGLFSNRSVKMLSLCGILQRSISGKESPEMESIDLFLSSPDCTIESLIFANNAFGIDEAIHLRKALVLNKHLTKLSLYNNQLGDGGCKEICEALKNNSTLKYLDISNNSIGLIGGKHLAKLFSSTNCALQKLDISRNQIEEGMCDIFDSLVGNVKLKKLRMYRTGVTSGCSKQLAELLQKNKTMSEYCFDDSLRDDIIPALIANSLKENTTIKKIMITNCGMTTITFTKILQALTANKTLTHLALGPSLALLPEFGTHYNGIEILTDSVKNNTTLEELKINYEFEGGTTEQTLSLRKALKINHSIIQIYLSYSENGVICEISNVEGGNMQNIFRRNESFQISNKILEKTFVGHGLSREFKQFSDTVVEFF